MLTALLNDRLSTPVFIFAIQDADGKTVVSIPIGPESASRPKAGHPQTAPGSLEELFGLYENLEVGAVMDENVLKALGTTIDGYPGMAVDDRRVFYNVPVASVRNAVLVATGTDSPAFTVKTIH